MTENQEHQGLYRPEFEHDSCGIGFVAKLRGAASHKVVQDALLMLQNMEHRGGCGCEPDSGDGAGILMQIPHQFFKEECEKIGFSLPPVGKYGVGTLFFPAVPEARQGCRERLVELAEELDLRILGFRKVPINQEGIGASALSVEPIIEQIFIAPKHELKDTDELERKLFVYRKYTTHSIGSTSKGRAVPGNSYFFYWSSLSARTIVYKGQLRTDQVPSYYSDLQDERLKSRIALVHSRFSTNTMPKWKLAQPFNYIAHNGEINTIRGNINRMRSKETLLKTVNFTEKEFELLLPICDKQHSDSANLDSIVELLLLGGRSLAHVMMMVIPEAWQGNPLMNEKKRQFYEYYSYMMEPWDGPASVCFTNGKQVGATLDRNGLRPSRYVLTSDGLLIMSSEAGALPIDETKAVRKGRLQPGKIFIVDLEQSRIISDDELKADICSQQPYGEWLEENRLTINDLPEPDDSAPEFEFDTLLKRQIAFGYSTEDLKLILEPMVQTGKEPLGSMGSDTPLPILSQKGRHLSEYFKQLFAQVSNPPIDPIRERPIMSLYCSLGKEPNILDETAEHCRHIHLKHPILSNSDLHKIKNFEAQGFKSIVIDALFEATGEAGELEKAIDHINAQAEEAVKNGTTIIILSDRKITADKAPVPSLLALASVHHHLIREKLRANVSLVVESGDVRETHNFGTLIGYGADAINPYLVFETIAQMKATGLLESNQNEAQLFAKYQKAIGYGLLKVFSKMGISTVQSYQAAQIFEVVGIGKKVIDKSFTDTVSRLGGLDYDGVAKEALMNHYQAFPKTNAPKQTLNTGGVYQWKKDGEHHLFNPETVHLLQKSARTNDFELYKEYAEKINNQTKKVATLRGLLEFDLHRRPIPIEAVEPVENIFKRFATGAMSFGSISYEAHSTLAVAMNRIGGKSNSGEGGEDESRFIRKENGDWERSAIKQVASGRFGVTSNYLANANELQIKMAQGAKPGEGGQLPGHKVDDWIGRVRHSTPGVGLISPPPHHDIYSIEDLAQLISDLKNANRDARINVKLVSEAGVGTIAAGVAKAKADVILVSGYDGGTGASPLSSIRHAGLPWELGLSEAHQTLVKNKLRSRVVLQTDGQIKTGRDIAIAALLGAEEWGVATAALVVEGCIMMRKCHLNTCPVGIATQRKELRELFTGDPQHVVNFFTFLAQDLREIMAELGFRTINEMIGQGHSVLKTRKNLNHWKLESLNLNPILYREWEGEEDGIYNRISQDHGLENVLDRRLIQASQPALTEGKKVFAGFPIVNTDRSAGTMLSHEVSKAYGGDGLPEGTIHINLKGSAGQSFGAFGARGIRFELEGEANDYFGKGLSGSQLIIYPHKDATLTANENIIIGNVAFYGATAGEAFIRGLAGERFCVRNSGAKAVVEGIGDHGCEYMTGGIAVVLGETGRNFAAGMSGGIAYIFDPEERFPEKCNMELVELEELDADDIRTLSDLLSKHHRFTGSDVAAGILDDWEESLADFVKVMPRDYKAALAKRKAQEAPIFAE